MTLESGTRQILQLAWSRLLELPDDALATPGRRLEVAEDEGDRAMFVRLFGRAVLIAPSWLLARASRVDDEVLSLESALLRLCADHGGRSHGEMDLFAGDDVPPVDPSDAVAVSYAADHARAVQLASPVDDAVVLDGVERTFTLVKDGDGGGGVTGEAEPLAAAGYTVTAGILADTSMLVRPDVRRLGLGTYVAAVAAQEAFADGLVLQLRAPRGGAGARRIAEALGLELAGSVTTVALGAA